MSFDFTSPLPLEDAVGFLSSKTPIGSILRTAEWAQMPRALRQRGQFSAGVESVRVMQRVQDSLMDVLTQARGEAKGEARQALGLPGTYKMDRQKFVTQIREMAVAEGILPADGEEDTLKDFTSDARLNLIFDTQTKQARGFAWWKRGQNQAVLDGWPAQELVRVAARLHPRGSDGKTESWPERWQAEGGEMVDGRMVALKTDGIWERISRFGSPWPPFDFNSGMGLREIDREEAIGLGLMGPDDQVEPVEEDFNARLEASAKGVDPRLIGGMKKLFGDQIAVEGDVVKWRPAVEAQGEEPHTKDAKDAKGGAR